MKGRVTIPTDIDVIPQTIETLKHWGADALRDCDGTEFPEELKEADVKIYATYYTTRKDNAWAKANPDEIQQCYIMTDFHTSANQTVCIPLLKGISPRLIQINEKDDIKRWWEVIDRSEGKVVACDSWYYEQESKSVIIEKTKPFHEYTVSFLAYLIWDPVHMYNALVNDWLDVEPQMTFDVRQPKTKAYSMKRLRRFLEEKPYVDVIRFTTFFHQFTLLFDELGREKYVDWYGYSASVSPYILEQFEQEVGYTFRPEFIIDAGYYNNQYRVPSKEYRDFMAFQRREVAKLAKEMVDICHEYGKEAMMFLGDHFIGVEPFMEEFAQIGLDAVVGSVGNGSTLRLISDIQGVPYTEGRLLPYFFPDTFHPGGDPLKEAKENWLSARSAIMRSPVDRIGYGGYLRLALEFPEFMDYVAEVANEFRDLYQYINGSKPYCAVKIAVLNCWGKMRAWGCHMVHHALYQKQNYSFAGVFDILSGGPYDVSFISFDDILENPQILEDIDVLLNVGALDTAHTGGMYWENESIVATIRRFVAKGGGLIGIGEPSGHPYQGRILQLASVLGVEKENGYTLGYDKYNWEEQAHFITSHVRDCNSLDFGQSTKNIYALAGAAVLCQREQEVQLAANCYFDGRSVYFGGLPDRAENARLLHKALLWSCKKENDLEKWFSANPYVDVHAYLESGYYCVCNNSYEAQNTIVYTDGEDFSLELKSGEIRWFEIKSGVD
ncbi:MAG: 1,3-beta-galactosyl-N-acetylhexosamine phosphorylase [Lachnospiraceae bacterium]|nr:1,3-beta-galactosyl-N-acetylhexosamine phosphorylase [Lachnospiraceae bacterium]